MVRIYRGSSCARHGLTTSNFNWVRGPWGGANRDEQTGSPQPILALVIRAGGKVLPIRDAMGARPAQCRIVSTSPPKGEKSISAGPVLSADHSSEQLRAGAGPQNRRRL
jgi:hypothetical protein